MTNLDVASHTPRFFPDNVVAGGQGEWSSGAIALMKVYNMALRADQVAAETADPSAGKTSNWATPEPGAWRLLAGGLAGAGAWKRLR